MKRRRYSREQWQAWLDEQSGSGLSVRDFCNVKGVGENSFYLWRKKLPRQSHQKIGADNGLAAESPFVALSITEPITGASQMEIVLPCGATVRMPVCEQTTRNVLTTLVSLGGGQ